jgi:hypothetical protein
MRRFWAIQGIPGSSAGDVEKIAVVSFSRFLGDFSRTVSPEEALAARIGS